MPRSDATQSSRCQLWQAYAKRFRRAAFAAGRSSEFVTNCLDYSERLARGGFPVVYDQDHLSHLVRVKTDYLRAISNSAKPFYHRYVIAKRSGKEREIAAPLPILKEVQRWILSNILAQMPATRYSKAYEPGCSIRQNARFHLGQRVLLLIDIRDFFPSVESPRVYRLFRDVGYRKDVAAILAGITTLDGCLPQGAPTSPHIANLICRRIDARIAGFCLPQQIRFTRYADDIAISGDFDHIRMIRFVQRVLADDGFMMACGKTRVRFPHQRQCVTGVIVNQYRQVDRKVRRRLRQEAYFISRFGLADHMQRCEIVQSNYRQHLSGKANHVRFINPSDRDAAEVLRVLRQLDGSANVSS